MLRLAWAYTIPSLFNHESILKSHGYQSLNICYGKAVRYRAGGRLPVADGACIDMDKGGMGIIADATQTQGFRAIADLPGRAVCHTDIDRLAVHMQAVARNTFAFGGEERIGLRAAIATDDLERLLAAAAAVQFGQQVEQMHINRRDLVIVMVAQDEIDVLERRRIVLAIFPIGGFDGFTGMFVVKTEDATALVGHAGFRQAGHQRHCCGTQSKAEQFASG